MGSSGSTEAWYLTVNKFENLKCVSLSKIETGVKNGQPVYRYYYAGKKISKKSYLKKNRSWTVLKKAVSLTLQAYSFFVL